MEWLIAVTGLPFDILILVLLAVAGAFAGFVDSIVGGGGLISVPAMLLTNLPPSMALGSNKLSSIFGAGSASITFLRNHMVDFSLVRKLLPFYLCGIYDGDIGGCFFTTAICKAYYHHITCLRNTLCGVQKRLG